MPYSVAGLEPAPQGKTLNKQRVLIEGSTIVKLSSFFPVHPRRYQSFSRVSIPGLKYAYQDPKWSQYLDYRRNSLGGYLQLQFAK
jgi:hypothetical protein